MTLFQINKFLAAVIVPISYGSIENVAKAKVTHITQYL